MTEALELDKLEIVLVGAYFVYDFKCFLYKSEMNRVISNNYKYIGYFFFIVSDKFLDRVFSEKRKITGNNLINSQI